MNIDHSIWMSQALLQAEKAFAVKEVPVGANVDYNAKSIRKGYNQNEKLKDPTPKAKVVGNTAPAKTLGSLARIPTL